MDDLKTIIPGATVDRSVFDTYEGVVPPVLLDTWRESGLASTSAGFVRLVDPSSLVDLVAETSIGFEGAVPLFTTALADIGILINGRIEVLKYRHGRVGILPTRPESLFRFIGSPTGREHADYLAWEPYPAAVERLGVPTPDDCFGFTPLLVLGGPESADTLETVKLREHVLLITQFAGPLR